MIKHKIKELLEKQPTASRLTRINNLEEDLRGIEKEFKELSGRNNHKEGSCSNDLETSDTEEKMPDTEASPQVGECYTRTRITAWP